jgi:acyl-CoA thioester hydrolase
VVETHCNFFSSAGFPDDIEAGVRVARLGNSSVRYEVGLFVKNRDETIAQGHFVHVYVERESRKPVDIPDNFRKVLSILM